MQELVDYSLGRWIRDKSVCQPLEKVDVCRQLCNGIRYLHDQVKINQKNKFRYNDNVTL